MDAYPDFFEIAFMDGALECNITVPESTLLFEDIIEARLNFEGKENKLWQLKAYLVGDTKPATYGFKDGLDPEDCKAVIQLSKIFNLESWAKNRNISCVLSIHGWGLKSISFRVSRFFHNLTEKSDAFDGNTPAT